MWRYFTHKNTKRYINVLQDIVYAYNHTLHTAIRMLPANVNIHNAGHAYQNIVKRYKIKVNSALNVRDLPPKYRVGQFVRISRSKNTFEKGYVNNFSEEVFKIFKVLKRQNIFIYVLRDLNNELIDGFFYPQ